MQLQSMQTRERLVDGGLDRMSACARTDEAAGDFPDCATELFGGAHDEAESRACKPALLANVNCGRRENMRRAARNLRMRRLYYALAPKTPVVVGAIDASRVCRLRRIKKDIQSIQERTAPP